MTYWLMKSEPDVYGIDHLAAEPDGIEHWDGIRNYQVRNMFRDQFRIGDQAFFYHSNTKVRPIPITPPSNPASTTTPKATRTIPAGSWWMSATCAIPAG
jgi:predicted RNA-binding protein with PUA-like domain